MEDKSGAAESEIIEIVITGGPCAGKSTGLNYLYEQLQNRGYAVMIVPEAATLLIGNGLTPGGFDFQDSLAELQTSLEAVYARALRTKKGKKLILLCDRGKMDGSAYMSKEELDMLLELRRERVTDWRDRYDAVMFLQTVAKGRPEFYTKENNTARQESPEEAIAADDRTERVWLGHTHLRVIDNSTLFEGKMRRLLGEILAFLGDPVPVEDEKKFLVHVPVDFSKFPVPFVEVTLEQAYLPHAEGGPQERVRRRSQDSGNTYYRTFKIPTSRLSKREERESRISVREYGNELARRDNDFDIIRKKRHCFLWQNQYFELDVFTEPARLKGLQLLELERSEQNPDIAPPEWLGPVTDVSEDPRFTNYELSRIPAAPAN